MRCPYGECPFEGTQDEVDDHVAYSIWTGDEDHAEDQLRERRDR